MNNKTPPIPKGYVATLFGGVALTAAGFATVWYVLLRQQALREERGIYATWEYRLLQAQAAAGNPSRPRIRPSTYHITTASAPALGTFATHPWPRSDKGSESSQARAESAVPDALQTKFGASSANPNSGAGPEPKPTSQRADDGQVYTKVPNT